MTRFSSIFSFQEVQHIHFYIVKVFKWSKPQARPVKLINWYCTEIWRSPRFSTKVKVIVLNSLDRMKWF